MKGQRHKQTCPSPEIETDTAMALTVQHFSRSGDSTFCWRSWNSLGSTSCLFLLTVGERLPGRLSFACRTPSGKSCMRSSGLQPSYYIVISAVPIFMLAKADVYLPACPFSMSKLHRALRFSLHTGDVPQQILVTLSPPAACDVLCLCCPAPLQAQ